MKKKTRNIRHLFLILLGLVMAVQICLGFAWMEVNLTNIPIFGDSTEYFNLSQTLMVDEYRPILYPLLIRMATKAAAYLPLAYQTIAYIGQTLLCIVSAIFLTTQIGSLLFPNGKRQNSKLFHLGCVFTGLYITCIPMITFMNFSILTDSIATSMLMLMIGAMIHIYHVQAADWKSYLLIALSMLVEYTIRADRLYTCTLFLVICFIVLLVKKRHSDFFRRGIVLILATVIVSTGVAAAVNKATQHPGIYDRIPTTLGFVLLDRVVWPNMSENYKGFSDEIKSLITKKDARKFDKHNNNVMYQMAPLLREKVGEEKAEELYKEMAAVVFKNQPGKVIFDILEDITCVIFTPVSAFLSTYGLADTADDWNLHCVSQNSETLSKIYYNYYLYTYMLLFLISILVGVLRLARRSDQVKKTHTTGISRLLVPGFLLCVIIALWFSIGDGAPPNDRYALLHYVIWTLWVLGSISPELFFMGGLVIATFGEIKLDFWIKMVEMRVELFYNSDIIICCGKSANCER